MPMADISTIDLGLRRRAMNSCREAIQAVSATQAPNKAPSSSVVNERPTEGADKNVIAAYQAAPTAIRGTVSSIAPSPARQVPIFFRGSTLTTYPPPAWTRRPQRRAPRPPMDR